MARDRSVNIVIRDGKILMEKVFYFQRYFYTLPGGGIEAGETPEEAAIRELKEECKVDGTIIRKLSVQYAEDGHAEHAFYTQIPSDQIPELGSDPEEEFAETQALQELCWMGLDELSEKDRAFLWYHGLLSIEGIFNIMLTWGDEISYPKGK